LIRSGFRPVFASSLQDPLKRYRRRQVAQAIVTGLVVERALDGHLIPAAQLCPQSDGVFSNGVDDQPKWRVVHQHVLVEWLEPVDRRLRIDGTVNPKRRICLQAYHHRPVLRAGRVDMHALLRHNVDHDRDLCVRYDDRG